MPQDFGGKDLTALNLSRKQLTELPPEIWELTNLTQLDLSANRFQLSLTRNAKIAVESNSTSIVDRGESYAFLV